MAGLRGDCTHNHLLCDCSEDSDTKVRNQSNDCTASQAREPLGQQCLVALKRFASFGMGSTTVTSKPTIPASKARPDRIAADRTVEWAARDKSSPRPRSRTRLRDCSPGEMTQVPRTPCSIMDSPTIPGWYPINDDSSSPTKARSSENPFLKAILNPIPTTNPLSNLSNKRGYTALSKNGGYPKYNYSKKNMENSKSPTNAPVLPKEPKSTMGKPLPVLPTQTKTLPTIASPQRSPASNSCCYLTPQAGSNQLVYRCRRQLSSSTGSSLRREHSSGRTPSDKSVAEQERRSKIEFHVNAQQVEPIIIRYGVISAHAHLTLSVTELNELRNHAKRQAEQLKVLSKHEVAILSQELVKIEEHCKYLQDTCISLQADRRNLQELKIRDLTSASWIGPKWKGRMLEREQELINLDTSIDRCTGMLEHAVEKRIFIRHRLLEHIAAILAVEPPTVLPSQYLQFSTNTIPSSSEISQQRVQSIPIFADSALFTATGCGGGYRI